MKFQSSARGEGVLAALEQLDRVLPGRPQAAPSQSPRRSYRRSIRSRGGVLALLVPALVGCGGLLLLRDNTSTLRGVAGFVLVTLGAPVLTVAGVPFRSGAGLYAAAVAVSATLWFAVGLVAARRATRDTIPTWSRFWGEYAVLLASVWVGTALAMVAANLVLGRTLI